MLCARLVNITLESNVCPYRNCPHTSLISWWTWHFHGWYVFNLSISQWKVTYLAIATLTIYVWVFGGPGVESLLLDDTLDVVSSTRQCHNRSVWISLLGLSLYMCEEYSSIWCVLNSSISQWRRTYFLNGIVTIYVWSLVVLTLGISNKESIHIPCLEVLVYQTYQVRNRCTISVEFMVYLHTRLISDSIWSHRANA